MKNKGLKITAFVLTLVICLINHPFILVSAKEKEIVRPSYINNSTYTHAGVNYTYYTIGSESIDAAASSPSVSGVTYNQYDTYSQLFVCEAVISFDEVCSCYFYLNYQFPLSAGGMTPEFICYGAKVVNATNSNVEIKVSDSSMIIIKFIFTYNNLYSKGYWDSSSNPDPYHEYTNGYQWINYGELYFKINSFRYDNYIRSNTLTDIDNAIDDLYSDVNDIYTRLNTTNAALDSIYNKLDALKNDFDTYVLFQKWVVGVTDSLTQRLQMNNGYYSVLQNTSGSSLNNGAWASLPDDTNGYKLILNLQNTLGITDLYYVYYPVGVTSSLPGQQEIYIYDLNTDAIYQININFRRLSSSGTVYRQYSLSITKLDLTSYLTSFIDVSDVVQAVYATKSDLTAEELLYSNNVKLDQIISLLSDFSVSVTNNQVINITNDYDTNINYVYNVENQFSLELNNLFDQTSITSDVQAIRNDYVYTGYTLRALLQSFDRMVFFKDIIAIVCIGIIILAMLG